MKLLLSVLILTGPLWGQIGVVQVRNLDTAGGGQASINVPISTSAGNLLVAWCGEGTNSSDTFGITDTASNAWTQAGSYSNRSTTGRNGMFYTANAAAVTSVSCNFTTGGGVFHPRLMVWEISGAAGTSPLDASVSTSNGASGTTCSSGNLSTTNSTDILILACDVAVNQSGAFFTAGSGYTIPANGAAVRLGMESQTVAGVQSNVTASLGYTNAGTFNNVFAAFKAGVPPPPPTITGLSQNSGVVGTPITITGANLGATQGGSTVTFNGTAATPASWSATSIVVPVPAGATSGNVVVTVGGVQSNGMNFTVTSSGPTITGLSQNSGVVGTPITITGTNFGATQSGSTVTFNGTAATPTSWSATSIVVPVPAGATSGNVVVTVGGVQSNGMNFTVTSSGPTITGLSQSSGGVGTPITITGTNFGATQGGSAVTFNGTAATPTSWSATSIVAPVPAGATSGNVVVTVGGVQSNGVNFTVTTTGGITIVQVRNQDTAGGGQASINVPISTSAGNLLVAWCGEGTNSSDTFGITDTASNAWTQAGSYSNRSTTGRNGMFYTANAAAVTSVSCNFTTGGGVFHPRLMVWEISGAAGTSPLDASVSTSNGASGTTCSSGNLSTTNSTDILILACDVAVNQSGAFFTAGSGYTIPANGAAVRLGMESQTVAGVQSNVTASLGYTNAGTFNNVFAAFKAGVPPPPPTITGLSQNSGVVGTPITITGANFGATQGGSTVTFNGTAATPASWSATSIVVPVPAGATSGNVVVTVGGVQSNGMNFTVTSSGPTITGLSQNSGVVGTPITITGTNFGTTQSGSTVTFNGTAATPASWSATSIVVPVPAGATSGNVVVTVGGVQSNGVNFTVTSSGPTITGLSQSSGGVGTPITITGTNFGATQGGSTVTFNGTAATPTSWSATSIVAPVPAGATSGNVVVTVGGVQSNGVNFTVTTTGGITIVQVRNLDTAGGGQASINVPISTTAGNLLVAWCGEGTNSSDTFGITDTASNAWTQAGSYSNRSTTGRNGMFYTANAAAVTSVSCNFTTGGGVFHPRLMVWEISGAAGTSPLDASVSTSNGASGTTCSSGNLSTTNSSDILILACDVAVNQSGAFFTAGSGYTIPANGAAVRLGMESQTVAGVQSNVTASLGYTNAGTFNNVFAAFKAGVPPPPPTITSLSQNSGVVGTPITITGTNLGATQSGSTVTFNGTAATPASWSATTIVVLVPPGATTGNVVVTVGGIPSNGINFTIPLSISPRVTGLTFTRTQQFIATNAGAGGLIWSVDGVNGGTASSGTISIAGLYTPPNATGTHTVTATTSDLLQSASATVYVTNYPGTFTRDVDNLRTGLNSNETILTPGNVNSSQFGKLFAYPIDSTADASPLYVANVNIPGKGFHNVVYVATEHDSVYAFDADGLQAAPLWQDSFINPSAGITTVPMADLAECNPVCDISPEIGITGSPVIDPATSTLYVVAKTKEVSGGNTNYVHRLHALDITTGAEKFGGPMVIQASVPGTGGGSSGGQVPFISLRENQRTALLLNNGVVYVAFAAHADVPPYHGWVLGYNATTLQQVMVYNTSPNAVGTGAGIWMSGDGLASDASGDIYFVTGNGIFDANTGGKDYGDSLLRVNHTNASVTTFFTPHDQSVMNSGDLDLGSGGVLLLPDQAGSGAHPHLALTAGKNGTIYVVDRDNMGGFNSSNDNQIVQSIQNEFPGGTYHTGNFKAPVWWNGNLYYSADSDNVRSFSISNAHITIGPKSPLTFNYPGGTLGVSSNGNTNPILWAIQRIDLDPLGNGAQGPGVLHAFDATNVANELYNSNQAGSRDALDFTSKWSAPLVANGKVYVASEGHLTILGLLP